MRIFLILIIASIVLFGGGMIYLNQTKTQVPQTIITEPTATPVATPTPSPIPHINLDPEAKWKIYKNTVYTLKYPSQLQLNEYKESTYSGIELSLAQGNPPPTMNILMIKNTKQKALELADSLRQLERSDPNSTEAVITDIYGGAVDGKESFEYSVRKSDTQKQLTIVDAGNDTLLKVTTYSYKDQNLIYEDHDLLPYILNNIRFE